MAHVCGASDVVGKTCPVMTGNRPQGEIYAQRRIMTSLILLSCTTWSIARSSVLGLCSIVTPMTRAQCLGGFPIRLNFNQALAS